MCGYDSLGLVSLEPDDRKGITAKRELTVRRWPRNRGNSRHNLVWLKQRVICLRVIRADNRQLALLLMPDNPDIETPNAFVALVELTSFTTTSFFDVS